MDGMEEHMKKTILIALSLMLALGGLSACGGHTHKYGEWETVHEATCFENGLRRRTCKDGDDVQEEVVYAPGYHTFGTDNKCSVCGYQIEQTKGLAFLENDDKTGFYAAIGSATAEDIVLPAYYLSKPVIGVLADGFANPDGLSTPAARIKSVWIADGSAEIGERAFYGAAALKEVTLPNSLKRISDNAFSGCRALEKINAPKELTSIGASAFNGCSSLVTPPLGENLKTVGQFAFSGCIALESANLGASVESVGASAFRGCSSLQVATFGGAAGSIPENAFLNCTALREIGLPGGLKEIGSMAFGYCASLEIFRFGGTMEEWKTVAKASDWIAGDYDESNLPTFYVICKDGTLNQYNSQTLPPRG